MIKLKKLLAVLLALVMVLLLFAACGGGENPDNPDEGGYKGEMVESGNTYADSSWLPVVKNPITVSATVRDELGQEWNSRIIWDEIAEITGVRFEIEVLTTDANEALMFAGRNYPDCTFRLYNSGFAFDEAKKIGDVKELTPDFLESYAPNWYSLLSEYNEIYQYTLFTDGKLYTLPNITLEKSSYALRDLNIINVAWLDELGLDMPTTTNEYLEFLRAVKNAAGTGSIPADVVPLQMRNYVDINGYYPIMDWFGCYMGFAFEYVENGKVVTNMANPDIKAPMQYIAQIYKEELMNENFLTAAWADYVAIYEQVEKGTPKTASSFTYDMPASDDYQAFAPLDSETGKPTYSHDFSLESRIVTDAFAIFSQCKYPIAIIRALDQYATGINAVKIDMGAEGEDAYWQYVDGEPVLNTLMTESKDDKYIGWRGYGPCIISEELAESLYKRELTRNTRQRWYYELYEDTLPTDKSKYPQVALKYLSADEQAEVEMLWSKLCTQNKTYTTRWIRGNSDINDDWDTYVERLNETGLQRRLELLQKAYDAYLAAAIDG